MTSTMDGVDSAIIEPQALDMLVRIGGISLLKGMIQIFLTDVPLRLAKAREGVTTTDVVVVSRAMHVVKSSAGQMGARRMMDLCEAGEALARRGEAATLPTLVAEIDAEYELVRDQLERVLADATRA
ncbi:MAG: Hpt domain-containing protein [Gemmatimonadaceae bacterium]